VILLPNLYGDILSDLCAGLIGGLGIAPGANIGKDIALFEAVHGSAPKYKGLNKVDPTAVILSGALMLEHLGETDAARRLEAAVAAVIAEGKRVTTTSTPKNPVGTNGNGRGHHLETDDMTIERTLVIAKPDAVGKGVVGKVIDRYESAGLRLLRRGCCGRTGPSWRGSTPSTRASPFFSPLVDS